MVVTRRTPVVPPLIRNPSSRGAQHPPRASFPLDTAGVPKNTTSSTASASFASSSGGNKDQSNGLDNSSVQKTKKNRRRGKSKYQKSNFQAFLDFLTKLLLLAFTIYTFSVCPQDTHLQSPICRGLTEYKRIVLDPYIIPPIHAVLAHPSVAPHLERAKPYVHRVVDITAPIILRTQREWNLHVVPQWERYIVPQWDKHVVPRIQLVQSKVEPYRIRVMQRYEQRIAPRAQVAFYNLQRWKNRAEPYVLLAVSKTKDGYYAAKPYAIPLAKKSGHLLHRFALFLREQRQKFVDPHVAKIWEKVKELSSGQATREIPLERELQLSETVSTILETLEYETPIYFATSAYDAIPTVTEVVDVSPQSASANEITVVEPHPTSVDPAFIPEPEPAPAASAEFVDASTSVGSAESEFPASSPSAFVDEPDATVSSVLVAATCASSSRAPPAVNEPTESPTPVTPSKIAVPAASATAPPVKSHDDEEIDLDAFYVELGLHEPLGSPGGSEEYNSAPPSPPTETEDERAERLRLKAEETARRRADIEARQAKWEAELKVQMEWGTSQLQSRLGDLRAAAAAELASSTEVRNAIEELVSEAEKYIKGAEIYLKNLKGENRRSDEKQALWDRVADRVNAKFMERLTTTEGVVSAWYRNIVDKELQEVATVTAEVREVAEKGQLDLGLDYAWLEDVTYNDWQRYHDLIATSERYAHEASSIQNGTHAKVVVINPMDAIFADLESEVQDVVIGFETRLRRIKRDGERAFNNHTNGVAQKEEEKGTIVGPEAEAGPQVSILPVPQETEGFVPPIVIGRSQEEVLEALGKVEPVGHVVSGSNVEAREAVSRLVREMDSGADTDHTEL